MNKEIGSEVPHIIKHDELTEIFFKHWFLPWIFEEARNEVIDSQEQLSKVTKLGEAPLPTDFGDYTYIVYGDNRTGQHHNVLVFGDREQGSLGDGENILVRVHSACWTNEVAHASNCECRKEIQHSMEAIRHEQKGIIVYLDQEGRGVGITGKMHQLDGMFEWKDGKIEQSRDENNQRVDTDKAYINAGYPSEVRDFAIAGEILASLGVKSVRLLTNNPIKIEGVESVGIEVTQVGIHIVPDNGIIASDLKSKAENLGHNITEADYTMETGNYTEENYHSLD